MTMHMEMPVGMENFMMELEQMQVHKEAYRRFGVPLPSFCILLDAGDGRTSLAKYYARFLRHNELCEFSGREPFLEFTLDGSTDQMKRVFQMIREEMGTKNYFQGVVAVDAMKLAGHMGEDIVTGFLDTVSAVSRHASVLFFCPRVCSRNEKRLIEMIQEAVGKLKTVSIPLYTHEDLVMIMKQDLEARGIETEAEVEEILHLMVEKNKLYTAKEASAFAVDLIPYAEYSRKVPCLKKEALTEMICGWEMSV